MGPDSFYFKGPKLKLNLKANNLLIFIQMGTGVDDETWMYHLQQGDYSWWMRDHINDEDLAVKIAKIKRKEQDANVSRKAIFQLIQERYSAPA